MPKTQTSLASRVLTFFRKAPMDVAEAILDLAREAIRERKSHSDTIRAAQETARRSAAGKKAAQLRSKQAAPKKVAKVAKVAAAKVAAPKTAKRKKKSAHRHSTNGSGNRIPPPTDQDGASLPAADDDF